MRPAKARCGLRASPVGQSSWIPHHPFITSNPASLRPLQRRYGASLEADTKSSYSTGLRGPAGYETFMTARGAEPWPADAVTLAAWLVHIVPAVSYGSALHYLAGVRQVHRDQRWSWLGAPGDADFLSRVKRGLARTFGEPLPLPKRAITTELLHRFAAVADFNDANDRVCFAASCIGTYCAMRGGEFLRQKRKGAQPLLRKHWRRLGGNGGAEISLHNTKANKTTVVIARVPRLKAGDATCPVMRVEDYLARSPIPVTPDGPLLVCENSQPLSRDHLVSWTELMLVKAGVVDPASEVRPPPTVAASWRAGGASSAVQASVPIPVINALGHWAPTSQCVTQTYAQVSARDVHSAAQSMARTGAELARDPPLLRRADALLASCGRSREPPPSYSRFSPAQTRSKHSGRLLRPSQRVFWENSGS